MGGARGVRYVPGRGGYEKTGRVGPRTRSFVENGEGMGEFGLVLRPFLQMGGSGQASKGLN